MLRIVALLAALAPACVKSQQPGDNYVVQPVPGSGGCRGVAEFLGACVSGSSLQGRGTVPAGRCSLVTTVCYSQVALRTTSGTRAITVSLT